MSWRDLEIQCPYCDTEIIVSGDPADYDWNSGVSLYGVTEVECPKCDESFTVEVHGAVLSAMVVDE